MRRTRFFLTIASVQNMTSLGLNLRARGEGMEDLILLVFLGIFLEVSQMAVWILILAISMIFSVIFFKVVWVVKGEAGRRRAAVGIFQRKYKFLFLILFL